MKSNEFVKKFGWRDAKETSNPKYETVSEDLHYCVGIEDYTDGLDDYEPCPDCVNIIDLMRLVESHELVENYKCKRYSGLSNAKDHVLTLAHIEEYEKMEALRRAIADVESCL